MNMFIYQQSRMTEKLYALGQKMNRFIFAANCQTLLY